MQDTYSLLREIADNWFMLGIFTFFIGTVIWAFRPGSTKAYADTVNIPFRHEDKPAGEGGSPGAKPEEAKANG